MRVAFVHDWLETYRGGEKVLEALLPLYPQAPIFTLFFDQKHLPAAILDRRIIYPRSLAPLRSVRRALLPILPAAIEALDLEGYDLIISTSSCVAKGVLKAPEAVHVCYMHTPMRYVWDRHRDYLTGLRRIPGVAGLINLMNTSLRSWDVTSSARVDRFIANSHFVAQRIHAYYARGSDVIHPPLDLAQRSVNEGPRRGFVAAGAVVTYKRFDLAVAACSRAGVPLTVAGSGPQLKQLKRRAPRSVTFIDNPSDAQLAECLSDAEALLYPGLEDYGMLPIEAMAHGTPVIAFGRGGALDTVRPDVNGLLVEDQTAAAFAAAIDRFRSRQWSPRRVADSVCVDSPERFRAKVAAVIEQAMHARAGREASYGSE